MTQAQDAVQDAKVALAASEARLVYLNKKCKTDTRKLIALCVGYAIFALGIVVSFGWVGVVAASLPVGATIIYSRGYGRGLDDGNRMADERRARQSEWSV